MFETSTSATLTIQDQEGGTDNHAAAREIRTARVRRTALGGNYVAGFDRPRTGASHAPAARPASGCGYTARFDGAVRKGPAAPVDSYTAAFGTSESALSRSAGEPGRYTDVNL